MQDEHVEVAIRRWWDALVTEGGIDKARNPNPNHSHNPNHKPNPSAKPCCRGGVDAARGVGRHGSRTRFPFLLRHGPWGVGCGVWGVGCGLWLRLRLPCVFVCGSCWVRAMGATEHHFISAESYGVSI